MRRAAEWVVHWFFCKYFRARVSRVVCRAREDGLISSAAMHELHARFFHGRV
jgi:hypothetical protein